MKFRNICVNGINYGDENTISDIFFKTLPKVTNVDFKDEHFFKELTSYSFNPSHLLYQMLLGLSLCHTVVIEKKLDNVHYNASSPDELALINFAKYCGFEYIGTDE